MEAMLKSSPPRPVVPKATPTEPVRAVVVPVAAPV